MRSWRTKEAGSGFRLSRGRLATACVSSLAVALGSLPGAMTAQASAATNIFTVAGTGASGFSGDGGPPASAKLDGPRAVAWMPDGGFLIADFHNSRVRRVFVDGTIRTVVGDGVDGYNGDNRPAAGARVNFVHGVAAMPDGGFLIDDPRNQRIRRVWSNGTATPDDDIITTVAGTGAAGYRGDGGPARSARLNSPRGIAATGRGGFLIADSYNDRVRCVTRGGRITTVAGNGATGFRGDGGAAAAARLAHPVTVAPTFGGGLLIADAQNNRVRYVSRTGIISTVAGNGAPPDANAEGGPAPDDGRPATSAAVRPSAVAAMPGGGFLVADSRADRVRFISPQGAIWTYAGTGREVSDGDGGPATGASVFDPRALAVRGDGAFLIAEFGAGRAQLGGDRVRYVGGGAFSGPLPSFRSDCRYRPAKLGVRMRRRLRARQGRPMRVRYRLSERAAVHIEVRRRGRWRRATGRRARRGRNSVRFSVRLRPGRYVLRLVARTADGRMAHARARLTVTRG